VSIDVMSARPRRSAWAAVQIDGSRELSYGLLELGSDGGMPLRGLSVAARRQEGVTSLCGPRMSSIESSHMSMMELSSVDIRL
jgi:hypothetical protein